MGGGSPRACLKPPHRTPIAGSAVSPLSAENPERKTPPTHHYVTSPKKFSPSPLLADLRITPEFGDAGRSPLSGRVSVTQRNSGLCEGLLLGGRLGGGWEATSMPEAAASNADRPLIPRRPRAAPTPLLVSPLKGGRDECLGTEAGCNIARAARSPSSPLPQFSPPSPKNSIPPPSEGGG